MHREGWWTIPHAIQVESQLPQSRELGADVMPGWAYDLGKRGSQIRFSAPTRRKLVFSEPKKAAFLEVWRTTGRMLMASVNQTGIAVPPAQIVLPVPVGPL